MRHTGRWKIAVFLAVSCVFGAISAFPPVHAAETYKATAFPFYSQEGSIITLVLSVSGATPLIAYQFVFYIIDPNNAICSSINEDHTTGVSETEFGLILAFPGPDFPSLTCSQTSLVGSYRVSVNQTKPVAKSNVSPGVYFLIGIADRGSYQRTQTMDFSFQAVYPSGEFSDTGVGLVTLARPSGGNITLTATYDSLRQVLVAKYKTTPTNQTGTWTASLQTGAFDDGWGNTGPVSPVAATAQLQPATFSVSITVKPYFVVNEQIRFNATLQYPDGTAFSSGPVYAFMTFIGQAYNYSIPVSYDSTLGLWEGAYSPNNAPGGLWALKVSGVDSASPSNSGSSTRNITLQDRPPVASFTQSSTNVLTNVIVNFDGSASNDPDGTIISYSWTFGDGSTGSGHTVSHSYASAGTFTVRLNVTDNSGSTAPASAVITVQDRPPTIMFSLSTNSTTTGTVVTFNSAGTADPDGVIVSYTWDFGDGSFGSGPYPSHTYSSPGTYTVKLTVVDDSNSAISASSSIIVRAPTTAPSGTSSVPLYWFGILIAVIAGMLGGGFFYFRRHRVTHANLKIDLEAVRSEAGRIESQEFFQSVKDQLKKDREGQE